MHKTSKSGACAYVNQNAYTQIIHTPTGLWTSAVDNLVENVENNGFSTVICIGAAGCSLGKSLYGAVHIRRIPGFGGWLRYRGGGGNAGAI